jgi:hypothetical protein
MATRPKIRPKNFGRKAAIEEAIAKILKKDRQSSMDRASMLEALEFGEMGMMTPSELKRLREELGMKKGGEVQKMEAGGLVGDQVKLDKNKDGKISGADFKMMEKGGAVRKKKGKGKKSGSSCRGAGAAVKGTRFSGIR